MIRSDFHTHSDFSGDSKSPMEDMIKGAISKGLERICFTEHNDPDFTYIIPEETGMFDLDTEAYLNKAQFLKQKYASDISILHGVELGIQEHLAESLNTYIAKYPFDFVIGSSHLCDRMDPYDKSFFENRSSKEAFRAYFESIDRNIRVFDNFDVYGHLDYVVRYAPDTNKSYYFKDYQDIFESIFKQLIFKGKGIEVNSGGYRRGLGVTNPTPEIIRFYKECGGEIITVASDAHTPTDLACHFVEIESILTNAGFHYYTVFSQRKPEFLKLDI